MKLGVHVGYWGLGLTREDQLEIVQEAERLGYDSVWTAEAYGSDAATILGWLAAQTSKIKLGSAIFQMPGRSAGDDGDDRRDARPALRRAHAAGHRLVAGRRWPRAGTASASPSSCSARASTSRSCAWRCARERARVPRRDARAAAARRAGQGAEADDRAGAGAHPDLPRGDRAEEHGAGRRDRRRLDPDAASRPSTSPSCARLLEEGAARAGRSLDGFDIAPTRQRLHHRRRRGGARRDAAVHRAVRRRDGLAQAELLQPARAALRVRGRGAGGPGPVPRGQARTRRLRRCPTS